MPRKWILVLLLAGIGVTLLALRFPQDPQLGVQSAPTLPNPLVVLRDSAPIQLDVVRYAHPSGYFAASLPSQWQTETAPQGATFFAEDRSIEMQITVIESATTVESVVQDYTQHALQKQREVQQWSQGAGSTVVAYSVQVDSKLVQTLLFIDVFTEFAYVQTIKVDRLEYEKQYALIGHLVNNVEYIRVLD